VVARAVVALTVVVVNWAVRIRAVHVRVMCVRAVLAIRTWATLSCRLWAEPLAINPASRGIGVILPGVLF
jgi:hypothetical protein